MCVFASANALTLKDVYDNNFKQVRTILDSFVGKTEQDIVNYMGVPSNSYTTKDYKYLEYITSKYKYIDNESQWETDCKILIRFKKGVVEAAYTLNNHNYCFQGNILDLGEGFKKNIDNSN
jgi:DNA topoisomerase VI subunit A